MGAAVMCARAIVRDLYHPLEGARMMSRGLTGLGVIAIACAPLGSAVTEWVHWRAALLLAFGVSQLVWGPLSDRFGRRPVLLIGMGGYVLASLACVAAPDMELRHCHGND